jgi:hypothetical protein
MWTDGLTGMVKLINTFRHFVEAPETIQLKLCREIIVVRSEIHAKHKNAYCRQKVEFLNVKPAGTYSDYRALKG